jgi:hypothetical protein
LSNNDGEYGSFGEWTSPPNTPAEWGEAAVEFVSSPGLSFELLFGDDLDDPNKDAECSLVE